MKGGCETGRHQGGRSRSHPLLLRLGYGALPDMRLAQTDVQKLQLHESFAKLKQQHGASALKASEWRCDHTPRGTPWMRVFCQYIFLSTCLH